MKTATILAILAAGATSASAAAIAKAEAEPDARWCTWIGQSCWKVKRAADAFAEALATSGDGPGADAASAESKRSNAPGGAAYMAKRGLDDLAGIVAATQPDPIAFYNSLGLDLHFVPDEPPTGTTTTPPPGNNNNGDDKAPATKRAVEEREADARWCTWIGQSCWKVRRAAEAVVSTIDGFNNDAKTKREASPAADPRWCTWIGQSCWKRAEASGVEARCNAPGGQCAAARRDLHAMYSAARSVLDSLPAAPEK